MIRAALGLAVACSLCVPAIFAQNKSSPGGIGFRNELNMPVLVEGASLVNGTLRRGQPIRIAPGQMAWDCNLSPGLRYVTIYDANQPTRILYRDPPIPFQGRDILYGVKPMPNRQDRVLLVGMPLPKQ